MAIADTILPEFDHEAAVTRTVLERVPEEKAGWKPHEKSYSIGDLAAHITNLATWARMTLQESELDLNPPGGPGWKSPTFESTAALLRTFDENTAAARAAILATPDDEMMKPWTLKSGGHEIFTLPRTAVLRSFVFNHTVHHRGQLTVYLRLLNIPVPEVYGPTADTKN